MPKKIRVGVLFGGKSAEHEVSLQSARNVVAALDRRKYDVVLIGIDKAGRWLLPDAARYLLRAGNPKLIKLNKAGSAPLALLPGEGAAPLLPLPASERSSVVLRKGRFVDVVFPVLHGTYGEDGAVQGLLKMLDVPFVGAGVLGSAVGMDKDVMKRLLRDAGIPVAKFLVFRERERAAMRFRDVKAELGAPFFVKPANTGSSVGVHKVKNEKDFRRAVADAFRYDHKIIIEEYIKGREIECSVLGNENPVASAPGEVIPRREFYSYEAKYIDERGADFVVPAKLSPRVAGEIRALAVRAFLALDCEGMARVDFFLRGKNEVFVNEINTIPGFTRISMYPKLWEASGLLVGKLLDRLIQLALDRHKREKKLKTMYL